MALGREGQTGQRRTPTGPDGPVTDDDGARRARHQRRRGQTSQGRMTLDADVRGGPTTSDHQEKGGTYRRYVGDMNFQAL